MRGRTLLSFEGLTPSKGTGCLYSPNCREEVRLLKNFFMSFSAPYSGAESVF
jgi:hypothetical protein